MFARTDQRRRHRNVCVFEAVESRQMMSIAPVSAAANIAAHAGAPRISAPTLAQPKSTVATQVLGGMLSGNTRDDMTETGLSNLPVPSLGRESLLSASIAQIPATPPGAKSLPDFGNVKFGDSAPTTPGRLGNVNSVSLNAQEQVNSARNRVNTNLSESTRTGGGNTQGHGGAWSTKRTVSDIGGASVEMIIGTGRSGQQMDGTSENSGVYEGMDVVGSLLNVAGAALSVVDPTVGGAVGLAGDALGLTASGATIADGNQGDTIVKVLGAEVTMLGWVAGAAGAATVSAALTGASAGLAIGNLMNKGYTAITGETIGDTLYNRYEKGMAGRGQPDPNSTGGDGSATILVGVKHTKGFGPTPTVGQPPEQGAGTLGGPVLGGAGQVVTEIKGVKTNRGLGSVDPSRINPAPEGTAPARASGTPDAGNINSRVGQPGGPRS